MIPTDSYNKKKADADAYAVELPFDPFSIASYVDPNSPFILGLTGESYKLFKWFANSSHDVRFDQTQTNELKEENGYLTINYIGLKVIQGYGENAVEITDNATQPFYDHLSYFSGRLLNSITIPFHIIRAVIDIALQVLQLTFLGVETIAIKFKINGMTEESFHCSSEIRNIREDYFSDSDYGQGGSQTFLADRLFLIDMQTARIKDLLEIFGIEKPN